MIWQELTSPAVRDLAWTCFSPPLLHSHQLPGCGDKIENCHLTLTSARAAFLQRLDRDPGPLLAHLTGKNRTRLGIYFESLWHFFLRSDPDTELLAHNLPIRDGGTTLGEFDILYLCKERQQHIHLELAVKFYLGVAGSDIWLGPGQRDRLDHKVAHITQRQIRLGELQLAREPLRTLGIERLHKQVEIKGYLFKPETRSPTLPPGYNRAIPLSNWYNIDEFQALASTDAAWLGWQLIKRERWLSPLLLPEANQATGDDALLAQLSDIFRTGAGPQMLACCDEQGQERRRCFVAPQPWPTQGANDPMIGEALES
ncbi:MAG: DUF1853 family protein [Gammaproteobacteria bacterium]|nr:DUF1853 family protein [Gammaproteobacteria bacterium]